MEDKDFSMSSRKNMLYKLNIEAVRELAEPGFVIRNYFLLTNLGVIMILLKADKFKSVTVINRGNSLYYN